MSGIMDRIAASRGAGGASGGTGQGAGLLVTTNVRGIKELRHELMKLGDAVAGQALEDAVMMGGAVVEKAAKWEAIKLRKWEIKTGKRRWPRSRRLWQTIHTDIVEKRSGVRMAKVGPSSPIGHLVEFGHRQAHGGRVRKGTATITGGVKGKHFMRDAYNKTKDRAAEVIIRRLKNIIEMRSGQRVGGG